MSTQGKVIKIVNGRIVRDGKIITGDYLYVKDGKFVDGKSFFWDDQSSPDVVFDAENAILSPGYVSTKSLRLF
ncbi:N-acetyl-glucosamine-6-phosphate deacetylase [Basidiobolus ranarum]|uniref:N-acetyl-glucosamine-6-phosphate deacetylase n=1 Tax=Basidiobolus ranarum TaxID=34480 RepID=A0ABR2VK00_9FUNG